jgi:hypothetical protein
MAARSSVFGFSFWLPLAIVVAVLGTLSLLAGIAYSWGRAVGKKAAEVTVISSGPTITELTSLGELVVLKVSVADVLTGEGGGYKGSWLVKGDALVAVDLRQAQFVEKDDQKKRLVISLPRPRVIQPRVDHTKTKSWDFKKTVWDPFGYRSGDALVDQVMGQAQKLVNNACENRTVLEQAEYNTNLLLVNMYRFLGYEAEIQWRSHAATVEETNEQVPRKDAG